MDWQFKAEKNKEILHQRARRLSLRKDESTGIQEEGILVVRFMLAKEVYGLETSFIQEVLPLRELTAIPGTPEVIMGVINVRGKIFPVIDLKKLFNLPKTGITEFNKVILIDHQSIRFGLVTDAISGTAFIPIASLQPAPYTLTGIGTEFILGITLDGLIVIKGESLINSQQIIVNH